MTGLCDGVNIVWTIRQHDSGKGLDFDGFRTLEEAALYLIFSDSWKPDWEERIQKFRENLDKRYALHTHEHDWVDAVSGPEVVGKVCSICNLSKEEE